MGKKIKRKKTWLLRIIFLACEVKFTIKNSKKKEEISKQSIEVKLKLLDKKNNKILRSKVEILRKVYKIFISQMLLFI